MQPGNIRPELFYSPSVAQARRGDFGDFGLKISACGREKVQSYFHPGIIFVPHSGSSLILNVSEICLWIVKCHQQSFHQIYLLDIDFNTVDIPTNLK